MRRNLALLVSIVAIFLAAPVYAITYDFTGSSSGIFQDPAGPSGMVTTGVGTSDFSWGTGYFSPPSSLKFTGGAGGGFFEQEFQFGTLKYYNGEILSGTGADSVKLKITLSFLTPFVNSYTFTFPLQLINTPNVGGPWDQADYVKLNAAYDPTVFFSWGGVDYTLNFTRFGVMDQYGRITTVDQFHVLEGQCSEAIMFGMLTANPHGVPEPASMLLLGLGLVGIAGLRRFRK